MNKIAFIAVLMLTVFTGAYLQAQDAPISITRPSSVPSEITRPVREVPDAHTGRPLPPADSGLLPLEEGSALPTRPERPERPERPDWPARPDRPEAPAASNRPLAPYLLDFDSRANYDPIFTSCPSPNYTFIEGELDDAVGDWVLKITPDPSMQLFGACKEVRNYQIKIEKEGDILVAKLSDENIVELTNPQREGRDLWPVLLDNSLALDIRCSKIKFESDSKANGYGEWTLRYINPNADDELGMLIDGQVICENMRSEINMQRIRKAGISKSTKIDREEIGGRWAIEIKPQEPMPEDGAVAGLGARGLLSGKAIAVGDSCNDGIKIDLDVTYDRSTDELSMALFDSKALVYSGGLTEEIDILSIPVAGDQEIVLASPMLDIHTTDDGKIEMAGFAMAEWTLANGKSCSCVANVLGSKSADLPVVIDGPIGEPSSPISVPAPTAPATGAMDVGGDTAGGKGGGGCSLIVAR